jgi:hypothetical protein
VTESLAERILQKIDTWVGPPGAEWVDAIDHAHDCAAASEGQLCCLDAEHSARPKLRSLIEQAIREHVPPEVDPGYIDVRKP